MVFFDDALGALHHRTPIHPSERKARLASEKDVFSDREVRGQHGFLMNHRNALGGGLRGAAKLDASSLPEHFPAIALQHAGHDLHQGGFAGSVFAHQQMDFAGGDVEIAGTQGHDAAEMFADGF